MQICSDNHDEICYEGGIHDKCPICKMIEEKDEEISDLKKDNDDLNDENLSLKSNITDLNDTVSDLDDQLRDYSFFISPKTTRYEKIGCTIRLIEI